MMDITQADREAAKEWDKEMKKDQRKYPTKRCIDCGIELIWHQIYLIKKDEEAFYPLCLTCHQKRKNKTEVWYR